MRKTAFVLAVLGFLITAGCDKHEPVCYLPKPEFTVNGVASSEGALNLDLVENQNLVLSSAEYEGYSYHWSGPNGYESDSATAEVPSSGLDMSGEYTLTVSRGICSGTAKVQVNVTLVAPPCTPQNNSLKFQNTSIYQNFYASSMGHVSGDYFFTAYSQQGQIVINFHTDSAPQSGIYTIDQYCSVFQESDHVCMYDIIGSYTVDAVSGQVYVSRGADGKYVVSFCSVPFNSPFSVPLVANCKITEL